MEPARIFEGHEGALGAGAFSPDGSMVVTASGDRTARLWTIGGDLVAIFRGHRSSVHVAAFTPDGKHVLTASWDGTVRTWVVEPDDLIKLVDQRLAGRSMTEEEQARYAELLGR